jgi:endoglucanase
LQKKLLNSVVLALIALLLFSCFPSEEDSTGPVDTTMTEGSAFEFFQKEGLVIGWNLGNSLDSFSGGKGSETAWGNPAVNQAIMNGVKDSGFNLIRIPVTWMGHIGSAPNYTISAARLNRVAEVVNLAGNAGLKVIINLHHDGATENKEKEDGWLSINKSLANANDKAAITAQYRRVWEQIAEHFKDYGDWLMFEAFNELHDGGWFWDGRSVPQNQYDLLNQWTQLFTDTVRSTGGNNERRILIIPSYCTGPEALLHANFKLPVDSAPGRQAVAFHYYRPDNFSLNGGSSTWDTSSTRSGINNLFGKMKTSFIDKQIPVIIGETGPVQNQSGSGDQNRISYAAFMYGAAKANGLVPVYWDNGAFDRGGDGFGLFNRSNGKPQSNEFKAVIDAMINAVK